MKHYAKKIDKNQPEIVEALRAIGATVQPLHTVGKDFPDLLVGYNGCDYKIEVKNPEHYGKATDGQIAWAKEWQGLPVWVVWTVSEALDLVLYGKGKLLTDGTQEPKRKTP